jgi:hypothetical protein
MTTTTTFLFNSYYFYLSVVQTIFSVCLCIEIIVTDKSREFGKEVIISSIFLIIGRVIITQLNLIKNYSTNTELLSSLSLYNTCMYLYTISLTAIISYVLIENNVFFAFTIGTIVIEICNIVFFLYYRIESNNINKRYANIDDIQQIV